MNSHRCRGMPAEQASSGRSEARPRGRSRVSRSVTAAAITSLLAIFFVVAPAAADDNARAIHWHTRPVTYRISTTFPDTWRDQVHNAAKEWTDRTSLDLTHGGLLASTDWTNTNTHIIWRDTIPSTWQAGCPPATTLACTATRSWSNDPNHIADDDTVFNSDRSMGINSFNCTVLGVVTTDVMSIALHEFGHWGSLGHTDDRDAVMFSNYVTCRRALHQHDLDSMATQYRNH